MRNLPNLNDEYDAKELKQLNAEPWMVELLHLNPSYVSWGPHEDYMCSKNAGWSAPIIEESWKSFSIGLDDLNEVVNFYFEITRDTVDCTSCDHTGLNPETKRISDGFYGDYRNGWNKSITQEEVQALLEAGRLRDFTHAFSAGNGWQPKHPPYVPTAAEVNAAQGSFAMSHDGINRHILVKARATRLGVYGLCKVCDGNGYIYTVPVAHVQLILWLIHPRKGASRGVEIKQVDQDDLPAIYKFLKEAASRNHMRFAKIIDL